MIEWVRSEQTPFRIRGGLRVEHRKGWTSELAIETMPLPARLVLPLQQHAGAPAVPLVGPGDRVLKGERIAQAHGAISAPLHAPTSGVIVAVTSYPAPHPSGLSQPTIILEPDGEDRWAALTPPFAQPFAAAPQAIAAHVAACGIVGLGGAAFPTAVKLNLSGRYRIDTVIINGAECEPYLTADDRLMREAPEAIVDGARLMAYALGADRVLIGIEKNKPAALAAMTAAAGADTDPDEDESESGGRPKIPVTIIAIPARYPMGSERHLVQALTGRETPARALTADVGAVVHNVATARAVHRAVRSGLPLIARTVTVGGRGVTRPANVEVPLGTRVADLLAHCGGLRGEPARLIAGGPMMGQPLPTTDAPIVKGTSAILALDQSEVRTGPVQPCLRCGTCVGVCPCGLVPADLAALIRADQLEEAAATGLMDCLSCGSCAYACPSHLPLVQAFTYAKGRLGAMDRDKRKHARIRRMTEARTLRLARRAEAKKAAKETRKKAKAQTTSAE